MKAKEKSWRSHLTDGRASQWACTAVSIVHPRRRGSGSDEGAS
jgi:hypothetical protein